jgi:hypothetical protein
VAHDEKTLRRRSGARNHEGTDMQAGSWELNVSKSKMTGTSLPKSQTRTYESNSKQRKSVQKGIDAQGKSTLVQFTANVGRQLHRYIYTKEKWQGGCHWSPRRQ